MIEHSSEDYKGYRIKILYDEDPSNPREDRDNLGIMVYKHRRYKLGDEEIGDPIDFLCDPIGIDEEEREYNNEYLAEVFAKAQEKLAILPLYLYDHSGITMSTSPFSCPWDSGQVGYIYCPLERAINNFMVSQNSDWDTPLVNWYGDDKVSLRQATEKVLQAEVEDFDSYISGEVYGFKIMEIDKDDPDEEGDEINSCWGYFGDEGINEIIKEGKHTIDNHIKRLEEQSISGSEIISVND